MSELENKNGAILYEAKKFTLRNREVVAKSGKIATKEFIDHPGAVTILPIVDNTHIIMIKNYRFSVEQTLWELPAGTRERGEEPVETAKRELIEESGYRAEKIDELCRFYTTPGICNELMISYVAKELRHVGQNLEEGEEIDVEILAIDRIREMIANGNIRDGKSLCTLLYFFTML